MKGRRRSKERLRRRERKKQEDMKKKQQQKLKEAEGSCECSYAGYKKVLSSWKGIVTRMNDQSFVKSTWLPGGWKGRDKTDN